MRHCLEILAVVSISAAAEAMAGQVGRAGGVGQASESAPRTQPQQHTPPVTVISASKSLDVHVEMPASPAKKARIVLVNHSERALLAVEFVAFRGAERVIRGRRTSPRDEPLVLARSDYTIELAAPFDRLAVSSVVWDDGSVEGDPGLLADERVLDIGKAAAIRGVMKVLREYRDLGERQALDNLRMRLAALPVTPDVPSARGAQVGMQQVKTAALDDLMAFERAQPSPTAAAWRAWLDQTISSYEDWFARIAAR